MSNSLLLYTCTLLQVKLESQRLREERVEKMASFKDIDSKSMYNFVTVAPLHQYRLQCWCYCWYLCGYSVTLHCCSGGCDCSSGHPAEEEEVSPFAFVVIIPLPLWCLQYSHCNRHITAEFYGLITLTSKSCLSFQEAIKLCTVAVGVELQ